MKSGAGIGRDAEVGGYGLKEECSGSRRERAREGGEMQLITVDDPLSSFGDSSPAGKYEV